MYIKVVHCFNRCKLITEKKCNIWKKAKEFKKVNIQASSIYVSMITCPCICGYISMYLWLHVHVCIYGYCPCIYGYMSMYLWLHVHVSMVTCLCICGYMSMYLWLHVYVSVVTYQCICGYISMYLWLYINVSM